MAKKKYDPEAEGWKTPKNLLKPGEDAGEGYEGYESAYPDTEEDIKDKKVGRSAPRMYHGGSVTVKTKLGKNKPTKIC